VTNSQKFDVHTDVRLFAPKEMGVELVPLQDIEGAEFALFWAAVFLSVASSAFGAFISLITTNFQNQPVVYLLGIFCIVFFALFMGFSASGLKKRKRARGHSQTPEAVSTMQEEKAASTRERLLNDSIAFYKLLKEKVFNESNTLSLSEFRNRTSVAIVLTLGFDSDKANKLLSVLRFINAVIFKDEGTENETVEFNPNLAEEQIREQLKGLSA